MNINIKIILKIYAYAKRISIKYKLIFLFNKNNILKCLSQVINK